jgi:hypothetical protein
MKIEKNCIIVIILFALCLSSSSFAESKKSLKAGEVSLEIVMDGKLDESDWIEAESGQEFIMFEPQRGELSSYKTEFKVLTSNNYIYFGIRCYDPEPERIISRLTKRDSKLLEDDCIGVGIDTFMDGRTAYYFFTNSLGTQGDGRLSDNGRTSDSTWDGEWYSAAVRDKNGWTAEIKIPLSILKYKPGKSSSWGLGIVRSIPRVLEKDTWTGPMEAVTRVSQFGRLTGLNLKRSEKRLELIAYGISKLPKGHSAEVSAGLDARYAVSQNISANLTINPDFATVEADQEKINLSRFELRLPEKRNFFLEGSEIYNQRIKLFYSRRIADIYGGIKLYGKKNGYEFSLTSVQSKSLQIHENDTANYSILRFKKDIFKSSTIGFLIANKLINGKNYGNVGVDLVHFFSEKVNLTGQLAMSYGEFKKENIAFFLRPSYDSSTFHLHLRYTQLGENFAENANNIGYVRDDNRHELDSALEKTWWIKDKVFKRINYGSNYNIYWSKKGVLRSYQIYQAAELDFSNKMSFRVNYVYEYKLYEKKFFDHALGFELGYNTREWQSVRVKYRTGRNEDLDYQLIGAAFNYKLLKSFSVEYELNRLAFSPDPDSKSTWLHVLRLTNYFTKDLFFKFFYQTNSAITKTNFQVLFVYRYHPPFGTVQLAYHKGSLRFGQRGQEEQSVFIKLTYVF